eukprot:300819_1
MLLKVFTYAIVFNVAYSANEGVQGTVQSQASNYCGDYITGIVDYGYSNAHVWVFQTSTNPVDVTFSTCNSAQQFQEGLVLYDYKGDASQATQLGECYHSTGEGCTACGAKLTSWTVLGVGGGYEQFYIEIYSVENTGGPYSYRIDISCTDAPTTPNPTTSQPTTAIPTTNTPTATTATPTPLQP